MENNNILIPLRSIFDLYELEKKELMNRCINFEPLIDKYLIFKFEIIPEDLLDFTELCLTGGMPDE